MDTTFPGVQVNSVRYDDYAGAAKAMDYLFEKGHRRIAFLQQQTEFQTVRDRHRAYLDSYRAPRRKVPYGRRHHRAAELEGVGRFDPGPSFAANRTIPRPF